MPGLREVIRGFLAGPTLPLPGELTRLPAQLVDLREKLGDLHERTPDGLALDLTYQALREATVTSEGFDALESRHLRRAPWVMFESRDEGSPPLLENSRFLGGYLAAVQHKASSSAIAVLAFCALYFYPVHIPQFFILRRILRERLLPLASTARGQRWRECVYRCALLDDDAARQLATRLAGSASPPDELLGGCCLKGLLVDGAFVRSVFREWLDSVSNGLRARSLEETGLRRFLEFAGSTEGGRVRTLRFPLLRTNLANGLLLPFADDAPEALHQPTIKAFLLEGLGDPRLVRGSGWSGVDERAREVMLRWLVEATLEDFFRLLEHAAKGDATARRHWRYRKAFWEAYLRAGHIRDAWVVLGPAVQQIATNMLPDGASRAYGQIAGPGVQNRHSVLILRIGNLTITEWSHSGKFRIWIDSNESRPKLYRRRYSWSDVTANTDEEGSHHGSENGTWQGRLADLIRAHTGISMNYRSYMPSRG